MDNWKKFNETSLPEKQDFYSHLNDSKTITREENCPPTLKLTLTLTLILTGHPNLTQIRTPT